MSRVQLQINECVKSLQVFKCNNYSLKYCSIFQIILKQILAIETFLGFFTGLLNRA